MKYQRGGSATVSTWVALLLLVALASSAALNVYQFKHRVYMVAVPVSKPRVKHTGVIPKYAANCEDAGVYCYLKI